MTLQEQFPSLCFASEADSFIDQCPNMSIREQLSYCHVSDIKFIDPQIHVPIHIVSSPSGDVTVNIDCGLTPHEQFEELATELAETFFRNIDDSVPQTLLDDFTVEFSKKWIDANRTDSKLNQYFAERASLLKLNDDD